MSLQAASLYALVSVQGGQASVRELQMVGGAAAHSEAGLSHLHGGLSRVQKGFGAFTGALGHAKGAIGELAGPLGLVGLSGGILTIAGAFEQGIGKAEEMALGVEKLTAVSGLGAHVASQLVAVFGRFNIEGDRLAKVAGFAEKTLGKLDKTQTHAGKTAADVAKAQDAVTRAHERLILAEGRSSQATAAGNLTSAQRLRLQEQLQVAEQRYAEIRASTTVKLSTREAARNRILDIQRQLEGKAVPSAQKLTASRFAIRDATAALADAERRLADVKAHQGATSTNALAALEKEYGISLHDSSGHVVDFAHELLVLSDVFTSNIDVSKKDALAATLLGKSYADLTPILALGRTGIIDLETEADKLGLTLKTAADVQKVHDFIEAQRTAKDAVAGLEIQLGLLAMPDLTSGLRSFTGYLETHQADVKSFFVGMLHSAEGIASFVTGTLVPTVRGLVTTATGFWNSVPKPLRDLLVTGFIAGKVSKFVFGIDVGPGGWLHAGEHLGGAFLKAAGKGVAASVAEGAEAGIGKSVAQGLIGKYLVQPVFVTNPGFGLPGGAGAAAAEGAGLAEAGAAAGGLGLGTIAVGVAAGTAVAALGIMGLGWLINATSSQAQMDATAAAVLDANRRRYDPNYGKPGSGTGGAAQTGGVSPDDRQAINDANRSFDTESTGVRRAIEAQTQQDLTWDTRAEASRQRQADAVSKLASGLHKPPTDPAKAYQYLIAGIEKRSQAKFHWASGNAPDSWVQGTFGRDLIRYEQRILRSHEAAAQKIADLKRLEAIAIAGKDWGVAQKIQTAIKQQQLIANTTVNLKVDGQTLATALVQTKQFGRTAS